ncbi:MAG: hypothetical protein KAJ19_12410 [Gammaproteobacteria bacterium]|nr:hypothetical protein [Gammaproteobacteria bacterium]
MMAIERGQKTDEASEAKINANASNNVPDLKQAVSDLADVVIELEARLRRLELRL